MLLLVVEQGLCAVVRVEPDVRSGGELGLQGCMLVLVLRLGASLVCGQGVWVWIHTKSAEARVGIGGREGEVMVGETKTETKTGGDKEKDEDVVEDADQEGKVVGRDASLVVFVGVVFSMGFWFLSGAAWR